MMLESLSIQPSLLPHTNGTAKLVLSGEPQNIVSLIKDIQDKHQYHLIDRNTISLSIAADYMTYLAYTALDYLKMGLRLIGSGYSHSCMSPN